MADRYKTRMATTSCSVRTRLAIISWITRSTVTTELRERSRTGCACRLFRTPTTRLCICGMGIPTSPPVRRTEPESGRMATRGSGTLALQPCHWPPIRRPTATTGLIMKYCRKREYSAQRDGSMGREIPSLIFLRAQATNPQAHSRWKHG